ncbi:uncharacterized protein LOC107765403 isoform X1 [Nicotiana tabacum]|uniref:Uncharacterized protein n=2 Tax=Nicotiana tabacum TaxID=4097 RepID=A0A1S3XIM6_TOBAC|nr:PREDICTED: uncharacterized protein LOC107765403 [Nicotiana tabacum]XP_016439528.1 PREDICTED: uncharacterized protein LOC107765403 [Nicotiana tabacum]
MICEANMLESRSYEGIQGATDIHAFLDRLEFAASEDITRFGGLSVSKKVPSSGTIGSSSSPKLVDRFSAPSVNPDRRRKIMLSIPEDVRIREVHEAEVRDLVEKNDTYKLLSEKLQANLVTVRDEHAEMAEQVFRVLHDNEDELEITTNDPILQVRQRLEQIGRLQTQVDAIQAEAEEFEKNTDILASKKETVQAQLESVEAQLQAAKEKASVQVEKIKELQYRLDLVVSDKASLANELEVARSEVVVARSEVAIANEKADAKVAQFRVDVEVNQDKAKGMVKHAKWQARREALEGVQAQGFDIKAEIENARV